MKLLSNVIQSSATPALALALALAAAGCVGDAQSEPKEEERVGAAAEALVSSTFLAWTGGSTAVDHDLGSNANQTCFLTGVRGSFRGADSGALTFGSVVVSEINGRWHLKTQPGTGGGVEAMVTCINVVANRMHISWADDPTHYQETPAQVPFDGTPGPNTHCFMTSVRSTTGWGGMYDGMQTGVGLNGALLGGWLEPRLDGESGGGGTAVCVDFATTGGATFSWEAGTGATVVTNIAADTPGLVCGAIGFGGNFDAATPHRGVQVRLNPINQQWQLVAQDNMEIDAQCFWTQ